MVPWLSLPLLPLPRRRPCRYRLLRLPARKREGRSAGRPWRAGVRRRPSRRGPSAGLGSRRCGRRWRGRRRYRTMLSLLLRLPPPLLPPPLPGLLFLLQLILLQPAAWRRQAPEAKPSHLRRTERKGSGSGQGEGRSRGRRGRTRRGGVHGGGARVERHLRITYYLGAEGERAYSGSGGPSFLSL